MTDRELIIDALRTMEYHARRHAEDASVPAVKAANAQRAEDCLRIRAELQDNPDYVVRGGGA